MSNKLLLPYGSAGYGAISAKAGNNKNIEPASVSRKNALRPYGSDEFVAISAKAGPIKVIEPAAIVRKNKR